MVSIFLISIKTEIIIHDGRRNTSRIESERKMSKMHSIKILITGVGAPGAPGIIRCLRSIRERKIILIGTDKNQMASGRKLVDDFYVVPDATDSRFIDELINVAENISADVVIPLVTKELDVISENLRLFQEKKIIVSCMEAEKLKMSNDKAILLETLRTDGFETPEFKTVTTVDELINAVYEMGYPNKAVCIKSAKGNGSRGVRIIDPNRSLFDMFFFEKPNSLFSTLDNVVDVLRERESLPKMLVMEYLPGEEYGVDALSDKGKVIYISGRRNITVNNSIPQGCVIEERVDPICYSKKVIEKYCLDGNLNFDFKYDCNGRAQIMEINPRLSATIIAYAPAGINFPYLRVKQLLGEELPAVSANNGIVMQRRYQEFFFDTNGEEIIGF